jgi:serine protease Do
MDDGARLKATLIGQDAKTDLALLKVEAGHMLPFVSFGDSDAARVGDWVLAVGNPFGLGNSVTAGIVSARGRDINAGPYDDFLQTDAPINRGNSGGPMFSLTGEVIGVNTLIYSPSGGSVGIGFATPAAIVKPVIEQLRKYGHTQRGWLGVRIQSMSDDLAQKLGLAKPTGALVAAVIESGPAAAAHLREGDVILRFNGKPVQNRHALPRIVADTEFGRRVEIVVWREGHELALTVELGRLEDFEASHASQEEKATPALTPKPSASLLGEPVWPVRWPTQPGH